MTLQQLKCFEAVARNQNFARASEQLFITQPAVSHHIRQLEEELGVTLFERSQRHVTLTDAGERFYLEVTDILSHLDSAVSLIHSDQPIPETLHVGFENTLQIYLLPEIYRKYRELCPNVSLRVRDVDFASEQQLFNDGKLDVLFTCNRTIRSAGTGSLTLFDGYFCCVMHPEHPLAEREIVTARDLQRETFLFLDTQNCPPEMERLQREIRQECGNATLFYSSSSLLSLPMIEANLGVAVMPNFVVPRNTKIVKIPFKTDQKVECCLLWHESVNKGKIKTFTRIVRDAYAR